jgi:transposase InsO family protein
MIAAQCCDLGHEGEAIQPETGMCLGWDRSTCLPAHIQAPSGYCSAGPFEGAVVLKELSSERRRFGYRRLHILLQREGWHVNWKKLYRIYREEG